MTREADPKHHTRGLPKTYAIQDAKDVKKTKQKKVVIKPNHQKQNGRRRGVRDLKVVPQRNPADLQLRQAQKNSCQRPQPEHRCTDRMADINKSAQSICVVCTDDRNTTSPIYWTTVSIQDTTTTNTSFYQTRRHSTSIHQHSHHSSSHSAQHHNTTTSTTT